MSAKIRTNIPVTKIVKEYERSLARSRMMVKSEIAKDCAPLTPMNEGNFIKSVSASIRANDPFLVWNSIFAKFLYYGKLMLSKKTHSAWARYGDEKYVTNKNLNFSKGANANAGPNWFNRAKASNIDKWLRIYAKGAKR
ncbi:minor capsid protein [Anaerorhabdus sp.]|uniref:minor capsid protein n=1 Tax=Anaerorhabdus sp. TaxID=1872524 RepID=UPI002FCA1E7A